MGKHKMDTMVKEKDAAIEKAMGFEAETAELEKAASKFEKEVDEIQRKIAKVEDQLDIAMSSTKETADKESIDAELAVGALKRRVALLEEEASRNKAKLQENIEKCNEAETSCAKNEEGRRAGEARSFAAEQSLEAMETELEEAQQIATAANHKFEDAARKCKVVEGDLERIIERAEEFESTDTRAEFAERSVDKLESTIDGLLESLMNEKLNYRNISEKLDKTLNDMMSMQ